MATIRLRGVEIPLEATWYNPRYRAGVRHCFTVLCGPMAGATPDMFEYEGLALFVESDMWHIAAALGAMSVAEREQHGWFDLFSRAIMDEPAHSAIKERRLVPAQPIHLTGLPALDAEHESLWKRLESLREYCRRNAPIAEVIPVIHRLIDDRRTHFGSEEAMMAQSGYPLIELHAREHGDGAKDMQTAIRDLIDGTSDLTETVSLLTAWEEFHITRSDQTYADYVLAGGR